MKGIGTKILVLAILVFVTAKASLVKSQLEEENPAFNPNEDADLTAQQLIKKYGYNGETHHVTTDDGYILEMQRITGPNGNPKAQGKQPVLIVHPLLCSSVVFILTGPQKALAYLLADAGYDVWMANLRGNVFSRKHAKYSHLDKEYWQFSWHESGISDLPSMIDYILEKTSRQQLIYLGHSMGTTAFWVMATERPEYQDKIKAMFALAPVAYSTHTKSPFYRAIAKYNNNIEKLANLLGRYEFDPSSEFVKKMAAVFCDDQSVSQPVCTNIIFLIAGGSAEQFNSTMLPVLLAHVPAGGSVMQLIHFSQNGKARKFQQYDHGFLGNLKKYKKIRPPLYDLSRVKVPVSVHYSSNDWLADHRDVDRLYKELGNPIGKFRVPHETFGHLDFIWANDAKELLYDKLIALMKKHGD